MRPTHKKPDTLITLYTPCTHKASDTHHDDRGSRVHPWLFDPWLFDPWLFDPWLFDPWLFDPWSSVFIRGCLIRGHPCSSVV
jgi:hypothetical protein